MPDCDPNECPNRYRMDNFIEETRRELEYSRKMHDLSVSDRAEIKKKLDKVIEILVTAKNVGITFRWIVMLAASVAGVWAVLHGGSR